jgi:hypothetical protein
LSDLDGRGRRGKASTGPAGLGRSSPRPRRRGEPSILSGVAGSRTPSPCLQGTAPARWRPRFQETGNREQDGPTDSCLAPLSPVSRLLFPVPCLLPQ